MLNAIKLWEIRSIICSMQLRFVIAIVEFVTANDVEEGENDVVQLRRAGHCAAARALAGHQMVLKM